jgi:hypothetical protein
MLALMRQRINILGEMEIMRPVARSAGLVVLVHCSRGSRPGLYAFARSARFLTHSSKMGKPSM